VEYLARQGWGNNMTIEDIIDENKDPLEHLKCIMCDEYAVSAKGLCNGCESQEDIDQDKD